MGKTQAKKTEARESRMKSLPRSERLAKMATIKKKEGRVLDASEKHALKMTTEYGEIMRLWEKLRTLSDPNGDPTQIALKLKKMTAGSNAARRTRSGSRSLPLTAKTTTTTTMTRRRLLIRSKRRAPPPPPRKRVFGRWTALSISIR
jgi:hypothetical protein